MFLDSIIVRISKFLGNLQILITNVINKLPTDIKSILITTLIIIIGLIIFRVGKNWLASGSGGVDISGDN